MQQTQNGFFEGDNFLETILWNPSATPLDKESLVQTNLILFDLDGTLIDSGVGIFNSLRYMMEQMDLTPRSNEELACFVGPPLRDTLCHTFGFSSDKAEQALGHYRHYYTSVGLYEGQPYEGLAEVLCSLQHEGKVLTVATSKPWVYAHRILAHFELRPYFDTVFGCYRDGRLDSKEAVVKAVLSHYRGDQRLNSGRLRNGALQRSLGQGCRPMMIGDRHYDVLGAAKNGIQSIGVAYGYGSSQELLDSGALAVVQHTRQLASLLIPKP